MEQRDYFMRQIEGILQLLMGLTQKALGLNTSNFEDVMKEIDHDLISQLDLSINDIITISESDLLDRLKGVGLENIYLMAELITLLVKKNKEVKKEEVFNLKELINKALVLIDFLDNETKTYSVKRAALKAELLQPEIRINN